MSDKFKISLECDERALAKILIAGVDNGAIFTDVQPSDKAIANAPKPTRVMAVPRHLVEGYEQKLVPDHDKVFWTIDEVCEYMRCSKSWFHTRWRDDPAFPKPVSQLLRAKEYGKAGRPPKRYRSAEVRAFMESSRT